MDMVVLVTFTSLNDAQKALANVGASGALEGALVTSTDGTISIVDSFRSKDRDGSDFMTRLVDACKGLQNLPFGKVPHDEPMEVPLSEFFPAGSTTLIALVGEGATCPKGFTGQDALVGHWSAEAVEKAIATARAIAHNEHRAEDYEGQKAVDEFHRPRDTEPSSKK